MGRCLVDEDDLTSAGAESRGFDRAALSAPRSVAAGPADALSHQGLHARAGKSAGAVAEGGVEDPAIAIGCGSGQRMGFIGPSGSGENLDLGEPGRHVDLVSSTPVVMLQIGDLLEKPESLGRGSA